MATVEQIYQTLNTINTEVAQGAALVNEDLSNIADVGVTIFSSQWKDNYVKSLIDRIGRFEFVERPYSGYAPSIIRNSWEFGSILAKAKTKNFDAKPNPSWQLQAGQTVNQFEYNPPEVMQMFWNKKTAWQIDCSFAEIQVKSAFTSAEEMNRFFSMIESTIDNARTQNMDSLIQRTINNFMAEKIHAANGVINVLSLYNADYGTTLTAAKAHTDKQFLRYLAFLMLDLKDRLKVRSELYNMGGTGYPRHTPVEMLHVVLNSLYGRAMDVFMSADTYHDDMVKIGAYETVPFWQGSGPSYTVADRTGIDVTLASDGTTTVQQPYIVGVLFDRDAIALNNENMRVTSAYNANGEYYNNFYKVDSNQFNDLSENGIVLVLQ